MEGQRAPGPLSTPRPEFLSDDDRATVRDAREEIETAAPGTEAGYWVFFLAVALLGLALLVFWPRLLGVLPGAAFFTPFAMLAAVLMVLGGPALGLASRGLGGGASAAAVEAALRQLESLEADREVRLRAATLLVSYAFVSQGATTTQTYKPDEVAPRVRRSLPLIEAVEEYLVADFDVGQVFTGRGPDHRDFLP